jgi:hypothetical protein
MYSVLLDWFGCTWTGERTVKEDLRTTISSRTYL